jgi:hypothetical protein
MGRVLKRKIMAIGSALSKIFKNTTKKNVEKEIYSCTILLTNG